MERFAEVMQLRNDIDEKEKADKLDDFGPDAVTAFGIDEETPVFAILESLDGKDAGLELDTVGSNNDNEEGHKGGTDTQAVNGNSGDFLTCIKEACFDSNCMYQPSGCGGGWQQPCTGTCFKPP